MTVSTTSAAVHISPVILQTFLRHAKKKSHKFKAGDTTQEATDDILFDEAFHIVKAFIDLGTKNTIESLQSFTNTHVPAPYWASVSPVIIPLTTCNKAGDLLTNWFGPEELQRVVGGEKWWQIRGLDGIDSEWITEREYLSKEDPKKDLKEEDMDILRMEHLDTVMLYVHGGGYFWGSINTHRYQLIRYARKIKGRVFAVNYRKAPQYPWPCPLQDIIAAYFYLTDPPEGALHKPVLPSKIVIAGDSAGGGLALSALTVLRDMGVEQPAGAVLISPWVDLTHSFPSVMKNTATDIIPPYGFIHKPSALWPIRPVPPKEGRIVPTQTNPPPQPGHADTLQPSSSRVDEQLDQCAEQTVEGNKRAHARDLQDEKVKSQAEQKKTSSSEDSEQAESNGSAPDISNESYDDALSVWEPKPPKVLMNDEGARPLELRDQIQIYATNEQLTHPLVSPILQGSLGNLCPLYIIAGDGEVLRDEIIYLAHKAANPEAYPTRRGTLREGRRQQENAEKFKTPTKVHLQVFDGMCHVLTVFIFTKSAKYAYRSIAEFVKHVTTHSTEQVQHNPFPELHISPSEITISTIKDEKHSSTSDVFTKAKSSLQSSKAKLAEGKPPLLSESVSETSDIALYEENKERAQEQLKDGAVETIEQEEPKDDENSSGTSSRVLSQETEIKVNDVAMIRERVDIFGKVRPMEPKEDIVALNIPVRQLGIIKEDPVNRWLTGQTLWDKRFKASGAKAEKQREQYRQKTAILMSDARKQGLELHHEVVRPVVHQRASRMSISSIGEIKEDRRWGPFDLDGEQPPPSAIAGRLDNPESLALMKRHIYFSAPATHKRVPKRKAMETVQAAFDPKDNPVKGPKQSVAEEQTRARIIPMHGLRIWQSIVSLMVNKSHQKANDGKKLAASVLQTSEGRATPRENPVL